MTSYLFVGGPLDGKVLGAKGPVVMAHEPVITPCIVAEPPAIEAPIGRQVRYDRRLFGFHDTRQCLVSAEGHRFHSPLCQVDSAAYLAQGMHESAVLDPLNAVLALTFALHAGTISCYMDVAYPDTCGKPATYRVTIPWMGDGGRPYCADHAAEWRAAGYGEHVRPGPFLETR